MYSGSYGDYSPRIQIAKFDFIEFTVKLKYPMAPSNPQRTSPEFQKAQTRSQIRSKLVLALKYHQDRRYQEAKNVYNEILQSEPNHPDALHLLGVIEHQGGNNSYAFQLISKAIAIYPENSVYYNNLGLVLVELNQPLKAIHNFENALQLDPNYAEAYYNLGNALRVQGRCHAAIESYRKALQLTADFPEAHLNLAKSLADNGNHAVAVSHYQQAIKVKPGYSKAYNNLGNVLKDQGQLDAAIKQYRAAIDLKPDNVGALNNLGNALRCKGQIHDGIASLKRAIQIKPDSAESYCNLGNCFKEQLQLNAAFYHYQQAIRLKPDFSEAHFNTAIVHLLAGRFKQGWREYEWRLQRPTGENNCPCRDTLPRWDGRHLAGQRLLVCSEQGFGDTLQFVRYLPLLKTYGGIVTFKTQKQLVALLHNYSGIDRLTEHAGDERFNESYDFFVPLLSLPGIFGTTLETIPEKPPYLFSDPIKAQLWQNEIEGSAFKVGLVWAGSHTHSNDHNRSIKLEQFSALAQIQGIKYYGLQKGKAAQLSPTANDKFDIINLGVQFEDFADTAGAIENLDLIISVDTAVAHLAGAMGKPVWLLLPFVPDWRWLLHRQDSPWYPTIRIFRQSRYGDWQTVLQNVASQLERLVATTASAQSK